jgi:hypothetical protein
MAKRKPYLESDPPETTAAETAAEEAAETPDEEAAESVDDAERPASKFVDADGRRIGRSSLAESLSDDPVAPVDPTRLADPHSEGDVPAEAKPKLGVRLDHYTPEEAARVDAREQRIFDYNAQAKAEGRPQALTKEEMDLIP